MNKKSLAIKKRVGISYHPVSFENDWITALLGKSMNSIKYFCQSVKLKLSATRITIKILTK